MVVTQINQVPGSFNYNPMNALRTVLVDDERDSIRLMQLSLERYVPQVTIVATFTDSSKALEQIPLLQPDLLFLDIEMPVMNGFELLEKLPQLNFSVVFVTAYNQFAIKAFRFNALDYLVKPVSKDELGLVVAKAEKQERLHKDQLHQLQQQLRKGQITKIAIPGQTGVSFIDIKDIVFIESSGNYAQIMLIQQQKLVISKTLKDIQEVLEEYQFLRIHRQYIINLNQVKHFNRNESLLTMVSGDILPVSRSLKDVLVGQYGWL